MWPTHVNVKSDASERFETVDLKFSTWTWNDLQATTDPLEMVVFKVLLTERSLIRNCENSQKRILYLPDRLIVSRLGSLLTSCVEWRFLDVAHRRHNSVSILDLASGLVPRPSWIYSRRSRTFPQNEIRPKYEEWRLGPVVGVERFL